MIAFSYFRKEHHSLNFEKFLISYQTSLIHLLCLTQKVYAFFMKKSCLHHFLKFCNFIYMIFAYDFTYLLMLSIFLASKLEVNQLASVYKLISLFHLDKNVIVFLNFSFNSISAYTSTTIYIITIIIEFNDFRATFNISELLNSSF